MHDAAMLNLRRTVGKVRSDLADERTLFLVPDDAVVGELRMRRSVEGLWAPGRHRHTLRALKAMSS